MCEQKCIVNSERVSGYDCACFENYEMDTRANRCFDLNECAAPNLNNCSKDSEECENQQGGFHCVCKQGFYKTIEGKCALIQDECKLSKLKCDLNANCRQTNGKYECVCIDGFEGDGLSCTELPPSVPQIDWCSRSSPCAENAVCENSQSGPICECPFSSHGDPLQKCIFKSANHVFTLKLTALIPIPYKSHLAFRYSATYLNFRNSTINFFESVLSRVSPAYLRNSLRIWKIRYVEFYHIIRIFPKFRLF